MSDDNDYGDDGRTESIEETVELFLEQMIVLSIDEFEQNNPNQIVNVESDQFSISFAVEFTLKMNTLLENAKYFMWKGRSRHYIRAGLKFDCWYFPEKYERDLV